MPRLLSVDVTASWHAWTPLPLNSPARSIWPRAESTTVYRVAGLEAARPLLGDDPTVEYALGPTQA
ncbi:hypothetical protein WMF37_01255 [Sorangium sp. So ce291]|uniref:hypothetical protein n=1 Tax=Sorangium sp. So ce291 TaxID=3133294 RepID=UPI003F609BC7